MDGRAMELAFDDFCQKKKMRKDEEERNGVEIRP